jgi:hypothetical protein
MDKTHNLDYVSTQNLTRNVQGSEGHINFSQEN